MRALLQQDPPFLEREGFEIKRINKEEANLKEYSLFSKRTMESMSITFFEERTVKKPLDPILDFLPKISKIKWIPNWDSGDNFELQYLILEKRKPTPEDLLMITIATNTLIEALDLIIAKGNKTKEETHVTDYFRNLVDKLGTIRKFPYEHASEEVLQNAMWHIQNLRKCHIEEEYWEYLTSATILTEIEKFINSKYATHFRKGYYERLHERPWHKIHTVDNNRLTVEYSSSVDQLKEAVVYVILKVMSHPEIDEWKGEEGYIGKKWNRAQLSLNPSQISTQLGRYVPSPLRKLTQAVVSDMLSLKLDDRTIPWFTKILNPWENKPSGWIYAVVGRTYWRLDSSPHHEGAQETSAMDTIMISRGKWQPGTEVWQSQNDHLWRIPTMKEILENKDSLCHLVESVRLDRLNLPWTPSIIANRHEFIKPIVGTDKEKYETYTQTGTIAARKIYHKNSDREQMYRIMKDIKTYWKKEGEVPLASKIFIQLASALVRSGTIKGTGIMTTEEITQVIGTGALKDIYQQLYKEQQDDYPEIVEHIELIRELMNKGYEGQPLTGILVEQQALRIGKVVQIVRNRDSIPDISAKINDESTAITVSRTYAHVSRMLVLKTLLTSNWKEEKGQILRTLREEDTHREDNTNTSIEICVGNKLSLARCLIPQLDTHRASYSMELEDTKIARVVRTEKDVRKIMTMEQIPNEEVLEYAVIESKTEMDQTIIEVVKFRDDWGRLLFYWGRQTDCLGRIIDITNVHTQENEWQNTWKELIPDLVIPYGESGRVIIKRITLPEGKSHKGDSYIVKDHTHQEYRLIMNPSSGHRKESMWIMTPWRCDICEVRKKEQSQRSEQEKREKEKSLLELQKESEALQANMMSFEQRFKTKPVFGINNLFK